MILSFRLTMPTNNSWNGKWSGQDKIYVKTRNILPKKLADKILENPIYHYNFGDGWSARIEVDQVTSSQAAALRKRSAGFSGYEWMIDSIVYHQKIITKEKRLEEEQESFSEEDDAMREMFGDDADFLPNNMGNK